VLLAKLNRTSIKFKDLTRANPFLATAKLSTGCETQRLRIHVHKIMVCAKTWSRLCWLQLSPEPWPQLPPKLRLSPPVLN